MLMQFVFSPIQGALSDRYGRRRVILISSFGLGIDFVVMALAPVLWLLFVGRIVSGICAASFSTANAYIADVTPPEKRAAAFGLLGAAFGIGFIVGPALGGFLGHLDIAPAVLGCGRPVAAQLLLRLLRAARIAAAKSGAARASTGVTPIRSARCCCCAAIRRCSASPRCISWSTSRSTRSIRPIVLYTDYRYGWGPQVVGYTLALVGLCSGLVQAVLVRRLMPTLGERRMILAGLAFCVLGYLGFGLASSALLFVCAIPFLCLGGLAGPPAQALMTQQVDAHEQGRLQGALTSLASLAGVFGPALFANLFALFISDHAPMPLPGIAFVLAAALLAIGGLLAWRVTAALPARTGQMRAGALPAGAVHLQPPLGELPAPDDDRP